ncbi:MAG: beta-N-acetylhexosaminidase [Acidobacteriota bacterium]|nr:beta-N-acetylhexosaminidase [Acidobacteriota bacterium]
MSNAQRMRQVLLLLPVIAAGLACAGPRAVATVPTRDAVPAAHALLPAPASFAAQATPPFAITPRTRVIVNDTAAIPAGAFLARLIAPSPAAAVPVELVTHAVETDILLRLDATARTGAEGYRLSSDAARVRITAEAPAGLFYGVQTLRQLMPATVEHEWLRRKTLTVPAVEITDAPRFVWRGAMLDVARHFFRVSDVTRLIDLMALHKLNRLHLHLADDQGWRIEIASRPNLTRHGGSTEVGGGPGGFYTKVEYAEIVKYAADRFITIVPEIDMPGHTNAALASYPELNCDGVAPSLFTGIEVGFSTLCPDNEATYQFIDDVVREIAAMTPGPYFHIGGDEVKRLSPDQYARFIGRAEAIVRKHGKTMIGWDEIAAVDLDASSIVQLWRPGAMKGNVAQTGKVIMSPANKVYLDMRYTAATAIGLEWAGRIEVKDGYDWDPATAVDGVPERAVLGVEGPLWTETVARAADMDYLMFPRLAGIAEIGWSPQAARSWDGYRLRLAAQSARWTALGINFYRSPQVPWR